MNIEYWNRMAYTSTSSTYSGSSDVFSYETNRELFYRKYESPLTFLTELKVELTNPPEKEETPNTEQEVLFDPEELDL